MLPSVAFHRGLPSGRATASPLARPRVCLWWALLGTGPSFAGGGPWSYWVGEGGRRARPSWGLLSASSFLLARLPRPPRPHAGSGALACPPRRCRGAPPALRVPAPRAVRAVFLLQTSGTRQARSGSRACTPPTTTRPTPASWYAACWEAGLGQAWPEGKGGGKGGGLEPPSPGLGAGGRVRAGFGPQRFWVRACLGQRLVWGEGEGGVWSDPSTRRSRFRASSGSCRATVRGVAEESDMIS